MKLIEKTPKSMVCIGAGPCPAVFETDHNTYIVIGTQLTSEQIENLLKGRIGSGETAVEFPKKLLSQILSDAKDK